MDPTWLRGQTPRAQGRIGRVEMWDSTRILVRSVQNVIWCCLVLHRYRLMSRIATTGAPCTQRGASSGTSRLSASMCIRYCIHRSQPRLGEEIIRGMHLPKLYESSEGANRPSEYQRDSIGRGGKDASLGADALSKASVRGRDSDIPNSTQAFGPAILR